MTHNDFIHFLQNIRQLSPIALLPSREKRCCISPFTLYSKSAPQNVYNLKKFFCFFRSTLIDFHLVGTKSDASLMNDGTKKERLSTLKDHVFAFCLASSV